MHVHSFCILIGFIAFVWCNSCRMSMMLLFVCECVCVCVCACVCVCVCVCSLGHHGRGPHYLARSHTDMATARWGQLADLFLFLQLFNELVMGRTAQLPRQQAWTPTSEVGNLYILGSEAYANGPLVLSPLLFFCQNVLLVPSWTWHVC